MKVQIKESELKSMVMNALSKKLNVLKENKTIKEDISDPNKEYRAEDLKQIDVNSAEEIFNDGYVLYIQTVPNERPSSSTNMFSLTRNTWDGSMNIYKEGKTPAEYGFKSIIQWLNERNNNEELKFYTLYKKIPYLIESENTINNTQLTKLVESIVRKALKEDVYSSGLSDNQFLKSPEYFVETYFNGQFSQLKKLFNDFVQSDRLSELTDYIDEMGYTEEIAKYLKGRSGFVQNHSFQRWLNDNAGDGMNEGIELTKGHKFQLGGGYTHFAIDKPTAKIINGWDYSGYDDEELKSDVDYYFINDLADYFDFTEPQRTKKDVKIMQRRFLEKAGINITDTNNWLK